MNKIITINLGGRALQIEDNAYQKLSAYFASLKDHFEDTDNYEEIIEDIEARFADMLFEKLNSAKVSINVADVEHVIEVMGDPSTIQQEADEQAFSEESDEPKSKGFNRRLFRDEDRKVLGGVCAGLANYLNIDVSIVRILWLLFLFVGGFGVILYIILWIVIPKAITRADKLQMMGEVPNIENIKKAVNRETSRVSNEIKKSNVGPIIEDIANAIWSVVKVALKVVAAVFIFGMILGVVAFFVSAVMSVGPFDPKEVPFNTFRLFDSTFLVWTSKVLIFLAFAVPMVTGAFALIRFVFEAKINTRVFQILGGLWVVCLISMLSLAVYGKTLVDEESKIFEKHEIAGNDSLTISFNNNEDLSVYNRVPHIVIKRSLSDSSYLQIQKTSKGKNKANARSYAAQLISNVNIQNGNIILSKNTGLTKSSPVRFQEVTYIFYVKEGTYIRLDPNTKSYMDYATERIKGLSIWELPGRSHRMTSKGLKCLDCETTEAVSSTSYDELIYVSLDAFDKVSLEMLPHVTVVQGDDYRIGFLNNDFKSIVKFRSSNNRLKLSLKDGANWDDYQPLIDGHHSAPIVIETPNLTSFEASGAVKADLSRFEGNTLEMDISGASILDVADVRFERLFLELSGATKANLAGHVTEFKLEQHGASVINAYDLNAEEVIVDISGASLCKITANSKLTGDISGTSSLRYDGNPQEVDLEQSGIVSVSTR